MDKCKKDNRPCIFSKECCEPEEKKMTNADRIRNMTDEELAEFIGSNENTLVLPCTICPIEIANHKGECVECILKWLQSEVKEGNSNENT